MINFRACHALGIFLLLLSAPAALGAPPRPGDYLIASRAHGSILAVDPVTGIVRHTVSGPDLLDPMDPQPLIGEGPELGPAYRISIDALAGGSILARTCLNPASNGWGMHSVDPSSGDRSLIPGTDQPLWDECGDVMFDSASSAFASASGDFETSPVDHGRVLHIHLITNTQTLVSGDNRGDGLGMISPRAIARLDESTLLVLESNIPTGLGAGLFKVDIATGDRALLSWLTRGTSQRDMIIDNTSTENLTIGDDEGGAGPQINRQPRSVCVTPEGRILVGGASSFGSFFAGCILEVDPISGNRTLLVGDAIDQTTAAHLIVAPSNDPAFGRFQSPAGLINTPNGTIAFTELFDDSRLLEYSPEDNALHIRAELAQQLSTSDNLFSGLTIYWPDFNPGDLAPPFGVFDFDDIIAFLVAFNDQNPIADSALPHDVFDFDDVLAFLVAFGGG